ncbi:hypothetical protein Dimus_012923, partial [Dionaea muscipula]
MGEHAAADDCGFLLLELGLDLAPTGEKICWTETVEIGGSQDDVGGLPKVVGFEYEEGEWLGSPCSGNLPRTDTAGPLTGGMKDGREKEIQAGDLGDDPAIKALVDSVKFDWIPLQMMKKECIEVLTSQLDNPIMTDKYEHVPYFCRHCSMLGHSKMNCRRNMSQGGTAPLSANKQDGLICLDRSLSPPIVTDLSSNKSQGKSPVEPAVILVRNSFELLDGLGDADGNRMKKGQDVPGLGVGLAADSVGQEGDLGARGTPLGSDRGEKGIPVIKPARGAIKANASLPQMAPCAGAKLGDSAKGKTLSVKTSASKPFLQRASVNKGRRRGRA